MLAVMLIKMPLFGVVQEAKLPSGPTQSPVTGRRSNQVPARTATMLPTISVQLGWH